MISKPKEIIEPIPHGHFKGLSLNEIAQNVQYDNIIKQVMKVKPITQVELPKNIECYPWFEDGPIMNGSRIYIRINASYFEVCVTKTL